MESVSQERQVWAAQYRKIQAKYIRLGDGEVATLPNILPLYQDVASKGSLRNESSQPNAVQIKVSSESDDGAQDTQGGQISEKHYYDRLAKATANLEKWL
jgi:hypothetical protein